MKKRKVLVTVTLAVFTMAVHAQMPQLSEEEALAVQPYESVIHELGVMNGNEAYAELAMKHKIHLDDMEKVRRLVMHCEKQKAFYTYLYRKSTKNRVHAKMRLDSIYRDSVNMILIPYNRISGENISYALRIYKAFDLDSVQLGYLKQKALDIARRLYKDPRLNTWSEEMDILRQTLDKDQIISFFQIKDCIIINKNMEDAWTKLKEAGLTEKLDSAREMSYAYRYYSEEAKINGLYRYYGTSKKKYLAELRKHMPLMVKMLDGLNKHRKVQTEKNVGKEFVW